jgi:hypothetical protein
VSSLSPCKALPAFQLPCNPPSEYRDYRRALRIAFNKRRGATSLFPTWPLLKDLCSTDSLESNSNSIDRFRQFKKEIRGSKEHRKVWGLLHFGQGLRVSRKRVLRLMREVKALQSLFYQLLENIWQAIFFLHGFASEHRVCIDPLSFVFCNIDFKVMDFQEIF